MPVFKDASACLHSATNASFNQHLGLEERQTASSLARAKISDGFVLSVDGTVREIAVAPGYAARRKFAVIRPVAHPFHHSVCRFRSPGRVFQEEP
jgi:hypothetical protein